MKNKINKLLLGKKSLLPINICLQVNFNKKIFWGSKLKIDQKDNDKKTERKMKELDQRSKLEWVSK